MKSISFSSSHSSNSLKSSTNQAQPKIPKPENPLPSTGSQGNISKNPIKSSKNTEKPIKNRDVLSNITNNREKAKKSSKSSKKSLKSSKRPSEVLDNGVKNKGKDQKDQKSKKRRSDPMLIDSEEGTKLQTLEVFEKIKAYQNWEDIDQNDGDDPQAVAEYANDIYDYLMEKEKDAVNPAYMVVQVDINEKMRAILVDWLVEVHRMFKLLPETLFLTISIVDRFLSNTPIARDKLQLVGVTAMLIASKYEEIYAPECNDFVYISDGAYTKQQILKMEQTVLNSLNFNITHPSSLHFLRRYSKAGSSDYTLHSLCKYLIEVVLLELKFLNYRPSLIAAGSVYLGRAMMGKQPYWTPTLEHYSTYDHLKVRECALAMNECLVKSQKSSLKAVKKKYSLPKFGQVSEIPLVEL